jgi:hypothetical protein
MKTITLVGNSARDDTHINTIYNGNIPTVVKGSRIALNDLNATLASVASNEEFIIPAGSTITINGVTSTITANTYTLTELIAEINLQIGTSGLTLADDVIRGYDIKCTLNEGKSVFTLYTFDTPYQQFSSEWFKIDGDPTITDTGDFTGDGDECIIVSPEGVPNACYSYSWTQASLAGTGDDNDYEVSINSGPDTWHGFGVLNGFYAYTFMDNATTTTTPYAATHVVSLTRSGTTLRTKVVNSTGTVILNETYTVTDIEWDAYMNYPLGSSEPTYVLVSTPFSSTQQITNFRGTQPPSTTAGTIVLTFGTNPVLQTYLGFSTVNPYTATGDPAIIISQNEAEGNNKYPAVQVIIEGVPLNTYSGDIVERAPPSVLYTITDTRGANGKLNPPINRIEVLDMNNDWSSMPAVRCYFRDCITKQKLKFVGNPVLVLAIFSPTEQLG